MMLFYCAFVLSLQIPLQTYRLSQYQSSKYDDVFFIALSLPLLKKKVQFHSSLSLRVMATLKEQSKTIVKDFMKYSQLSLSLD